MRPRLEIIQPYGLGDIIYLQAITKILSTGYDVIFPVVDEYLWLNEYYDHISFIPYSKADLDYDIGPATEKRICFSYATQILRGLEKDDMSSYHTVMADKYRLVNKDPKSWIDCLWTRNLERENKLFEELGLGKEYSPNYILVNSTYGYTDRKPILVGQDKGIVNMSKRDGYTLFDWGKVLENASEVHTYSSSTVFLADVVCPSCVTKFMYPRPKLPIGMQSVKEVMTTEWEYRD